MATYSKVVKLSNQRKGVALMGVKFVPSRAFILKGNISYEDAINIVERAGRTCYQSFDKAPQVLDEEDRIKAQESFIRGLIKRGHESVIEHVNVTMSILFDRGILAEWTRHRIAAYSVESTRYVKYDGDVECIAPSEIDLEENPAFVLSVEQSIDAYQTLLKSGIKPEMARAVLPMCLATNMVVTHNMREWRHILKERLINARAHPDFRLLMKKVLDELYFWYPVFFEDIFMEYRKSED